MTIWIVYDYVYYDYYYDYSLINVEKSDKNYINQNYFHSLNFFANSILHEEESVLICKQIISGLSFAYPVKNSHDDFVYVSCKERDIYYK